MSAKRCLGLMCRLVNRKGIGIYRCLPEFFAEMAADPRTKFETAFATQKHPHIKQEDGCLRIEALATIESEAVISLLSSYAILGSKR